MGRPPAVSPGRGATAFADLRTVVHRRIRDGLLRLGRNQLVVREDVSRLYLRGDGIEIGAFAWPQRLPPGARARYVDWTDKAELVRLYDTGFVRERAVPETDVVDDATTLASFADAALDFVVASHVLEHIEDPIGALENMLRVLRPGGILFLILPDARETFDAARERTTVEHLVRDHAEGPERSRRQHYEEWARVIESVPEDRVAARADEFAAQDARHHFHVWEFEGFLRLVTGLDLPCALELARLNGDEFIVVLRRT
ncbi:MAG: Methyltransferase type 11 [Solirubrobacteraceae bacterium]|nr:Methyltransferase type 11 [Solirubrobacteraceae bacterium]